MCNLCLHWVPLQQVCNTSFPFDRQITNCASSCKHRQNLPHLLLHSHFHILAIICIYACLSYWMILAILLKLFKRQTTSQAMFVRLCRGCRFWGNGRNGRNGRNGHSRAPILCNETLVSPRFLTSSPSTGRIEWLRASLVVLTGTCCTAVLCNWLNAENEESIDYGDIQYWLARYKDSWYQQPFDWLGSFQSLKPWIHPAAAGKQRVVHLGCGTSLLAEEMYDCGEFGEIWNIDVSEVCLQIMRTRNESQRPALRWVKADLRDSKACDKSGIEANFFDCAIDKSTLDSICDGGRDDEAAKYIMEVARILKPSGIFLMFSFSPPQSRLQHLSKFFDCEVQVAEDQCFVYNCRKLSGI